MQIHFNADDLKVNSVFLFFLLNILNLCSLLARSDMSLENWPAVMKKLEGFSFWDRRPLHYIRFLRKSNRELQSDFQDPSPMSNWQKFQGTLWNQSKVHTQNQPSDHQSQSLHQPSSNVAEWNTAISPSQYPLSEPRSFEFSLRIPFTDLSGKNKGTSSAVKGSGLSNGGSEGAGHYFQLQRPSSVQISSSFNAMSGSDDFSGKDSENYPTGGKTAQGVSKPNFQLGLSIPIPPPTPSPKPSSRKDYHANLQIPERVTVVRNGYMDPAKPQPSSTQSGSNSPTVQQQLGHQTYEPLQTRYTDKISLAISPGQDGRHPAPTGQIPPEESSVFPGSSASTPPISQYPPVQSYNVHGEYYNAQMNPLGNAYESTQSGQTAPSHPIGSFSQYEKVPSDHYSAGQVKPTGGIYDQTQTGQQAAPATSFGKYNFNELNPLLCQYRESVDPLSPGHPVSPGFAPPQYEHPSSQKPATPHYGADYVAQMGPTDLPSHHQYSRHHSRQDAFPDRVTTFDPAPNIRDVPTDYPAYHTNGQRLVQKPEYAKLFVDVEDVRDDGAAQSNYFGAASAHTDGYSGTWTAPNTANAFYSNSRHFPAMPDFVSKPRKLFGY